MAWSLSAGLKRLASLPLTGATWVLHRRLTGRRAVLHVPVDGGGDVRAVALWLDLLRGVAADSLVATVVLEIAGTPGGWSTCEDLRGVIADLRRAGKRVVAWIDAPGNASLWIASAADEVVVPPLAELELTGLGVETSYLRSALDRLGLEADVEAAGAYKSFGEPFRRTHPSPEAREALVALLGEVQDTVERDLAASRGVPRAQVRDWLERAPLGPDEGLREGLVDAVAYLDVLLEAEVEAAGQGARRVGWRGWAFRERLQRRWEGWGRGRVVAVLHLQGAIVSGDEGGGPRVRAARVVPLIEALREQPAVEAVVLHVDSPGGSAVASDRIWRAVGRLAEAKPVVACFGDVAASGGYYLASPAAEIVARPASITGSIGVFGGKLVARGAARKLGVRPVPVALAPQALRLSALRPFDAAQRRSLRASLQRIYDGFVERAALGRGVEVDEIEPWCRGRVWTGRAACARGLVDREGDLWDAVASAERRAELDAGTCRVIHLTPPEPGGLGRLVRDAARRGLPGATWRALGLTAELEGWVEPLVDAPGTAVAGLLQPELLRRPR